MMLADDETLALDEPTAPTRRQITAATPIPAGPATIPDPTVAAPTSPTDTSITPVDDPALTSRATDPSVASTPYSPPSLPPLPPSFFAPPPPPTDTGGMVGDAPITPIQPGIPVEMNPMDGDVPPPPPPPQISLNGPGPFDPSVMGGAGGPPTALRPTSSGLVGGVDPMNGDAGTPVIPALPNETGWMAEASTPVGDPGVVGNPGIAMNDVPPGNVPSISTAKLPGRTDKGGSLPTFTLPSIPPLPLQGATAIDPRNDLRSKVINTAPSARTTAAQATTDTALGKLAGTDRQGLTDSLIQQYLKQVAPDARLTGLQGQVDDAAKNLAGVDRFKLAQDEFGTYADQTDPAFQKSLRDITDREVGMGGFTGRMNTSYGDAGLMRERDLRNERSTLFNKALEGSIADAFGKESALSGLEGQLSGEDLSRFSTAAGYGTSNASADMASLEDKLNAARGVEGQSYGEDTNQADQLRSERDYEVGQEGEAYQRAVAQHQQEQQDQMTAFEREMSLLGAGEAGNPAGEIGALSTEINPGLDMATLAQLAQGAGAASVPKTGAPSTSSPLSGIDWSSLLNVLQSNQPSTGANG